MADQDDAARNGETDKLWQLNAEIVKAGMERANAKAAIEQHEEAVHPRTAETHF